MNRFIFCFLVLTLFALCGCEMNDTNDEPLSNNTDVAQTSEEFGKAISFYEQLCDKYGYLTYEMVYYPEKWSNYIQNDAKIYHKDWLCPNFDNSGDYSCSANPDYYEQYNDYMLCDVCGETKLCFLDVEKGIIHSEKKNLSLGTENFLECNVNYRFVSEKNAIEHGYSYCKCCKFD